MLLFICWFLLLFIIVYRMAKFVAGLFNLISMFYASSFKRDFFSTVPHGITAVSHLRPRFAITSVYSYVQIHTNLGLPTEYLVPGIYKKFSGVTGRSLCPETSAPETSAPVGRILDVFLFLVVPFLLLFLFYNSVNTRIMIEVSSGQSRGIFFTSEYRVLLILCWFLLLFIIVYRMAKFVAVSFNLIPMFY